MELSDEQLPFLVVLTFMLREMVLIGRKANKKKKSKSQSDNQAKQEDPFFQPSVKLIISITSADPLLLAFE